MAVGMRAKGKAGLADAAALRTVDPAGLVWLALCVLTALPLFRFGLAGLADAWSRPEYSHGPVIPVLSFYMFLHETRAVPPAAGPIPDRWPGVALIGLALLVALAGNLAQVDNLVFYALILWIGGLILTGFGRARGWIFWPSVLHLVFMLPLPQFVYWKLSTTLQFLSSGIGVWLVGLMGVPVFLDGNIIDLGVYKLQVAEACSGLRYLFPIMSFSYVFAVLYRGPVWHKLVLLFSAVPIAVLMNAVRIGIIGLLVDRYGIAQAEGFLHVFEGWVVFLSCIAILFLMVMAMQRISGDRRPLGAAIDLDFSGLGGQLARVLATAPSRALIAATLLTAALSAAWMLVPARPAVEVERAPFGLFPRTLAGWSGTARSLEPGIAKVLGADDTLSATYRSPDEAAPVDFFMAYYVNQTAGKAIHSPEVCLPGAGWEVFSIDPTAIALTGTRAGGLTLNRAVIQKGLDQQLVYYWFDGRGRRLTGAIAAKAWTLVDSLSRGRTDGAMVRLITPIGPDGVAGADARLQRFLALTIDRLPEYLPQ